MPPGVATSRTPGGALCRRIHPFLELSCRSDLHLRLPFFYRADLPRTVEISGATVAAEPFRNRIAPHLSSRDFAHSVDMENRRIAVSPFIFKAKKFLSAARTAFVIAPLRRPRPVQDRPIPPLP